MDFKNRWERIKTTIAAKPYLFSALFLGYITLNVIVNQIYVSGFTLLNLNPFFLIPYLILTLLVAFLVALNINLIIAKFKELKHLNKESGLTALGVFGGLLGGACPGCFVGLFPAFLGLFGVTAAISILPLYGLELQLLSVALLITSIFLLTRDNVCKIK